MNRLLLFLVLIGGVPAFADLAVSTDFPGGAADVIAVDSAAGFIQIAPPAREGRGWPCWWYFRVDGAEPGKKITVQVGAAQKPFRLKERLGAGWALPDQAAISADDITWSQTEPGVIPKETGEFAITRMTGTYVITAPAARFWMAWGPPFVPSHSEVLLASAVKRYPGAERFVLATTRAGNAVQAIRLGNYEAPRAIWVQARQHAWEAGSSWVGRGFLEWITSDDPAAKALCATTEIVFVPIMDVDNVTIGAGGKEAMPRDHNRDWADAPVYPEVAAAQTRIRALAEAGRLRIFLDLHNPAPGDRQPYFYGPDNYDKLTGLIRANYERFLGLATQHINGPLPMTPKYRFANYVTTDEERQRVSVGWVRKHFGPHVVANTLETAWNTPASNTQGYLTVGRQLGQTVAQYLAEEAKH